MPKKKKDLYQLKITLTGIEPPIWRRLLISSDADLAELHDLIQSAMGWTNSHLHQFISGTQLYGLSDNDFEDGTTPEKGVPVTSLLSKEKQWIMYEYDFGDGWQHKIILE